MTRKFYLPLLLLISAGACDRAPDPDALPVWSQSDHHSSDDDRRPGAAPARSGAPKGGDVAQLVDIAWRQQCTTCHGSLGRGDGQMGRMVQAPDLTQADWQSKVTDADMAAIIKSGKNRMPAFALPEPVIEGLVARIRSLRVP